MRWRYSALLVLVCMCSMTAAGYEYRHECHSASSGDARVDVTAGHGLYRVVSESLVKRVLFFAESLRVFDHVGFLCGIKTRCRSRRGTLLRQWASASASGTYCSTGRLRVLVRTARVTVGTFTGRKGPSAWVRPLALGSCSWASARVRESCMHAFKERERWRCACEMRSVGGRSKIQLRWRAQPYPCRLCSLRHVRR